MVLIDQMHLRDLLDPHAPNEVDQLTQKMRQYLHYYVHQAEKAKEHCDRKSVMMVDLSRGPDKVRVPVNYLDYCPTLTTRSRHIWIIGVADDLPKFMRFLTNSEKAMLQGWAPDLPSRFSNAKACMEAIGNGMFLPTVGIVFASLLSELKDP
eukprot:5497256-Pyramimonas_sp.AAC.1